MGQLACAWHLFCLNVRVLFVSFAGLSLFPTPVVRQFDDLPDTVDRYLSKHTPPLNPWKI